MSRAKLWARTVWEYLRELAGENDYARYRARVLAEGGEPLTLEGFYRWQLSRKYSRPNQCC